MLVAKIGVFGYLHHLPPNDDAEGQLDRNTNFRLPTLFQNLLFPHDEYALNRDLLPSAS